MSTTARTTICFNDSTFCAIAFTSITYLIFQIHSIRQHTIRLILFISFLCTCLGCEAFFCISHPTPLLQNPTHTNMTDYCPPTITHLIFLLSICSFLWNATQCVALASILLPSNKQQEQQQPNTIFRRWLYQVCIDHIFALLLVRSGRLIDIKRVTALSDMASVCVLTSWCSQITVFPCMFCFLHSLFVDTTRLTSITTLNNIAKLTDSDGDEIGSVLHCLKIIKVLGLSLFGVKISAVSLFELLVLVLAVTIYLLYPSVIPLRRKVSKYKRFFYKFIIGDTPNDKTNEIIAATIKSKERKRSILCSTTQKSVSQSVLPPDASFDTDSSATNVHGFISSLHLHQTNRLSLLPFDTLLLSSPSLSRSTRQLNSSSDIDYSVVTDDEILALIRSKQLSAHNLEKYASFERAVHLRRLLLSEKLLLSSSNKNNSNSPLDSLPYEHYDYSLVVNQCCENVVGYVQVPVGYAGPLLVDNRHIYIPLATTEGALVASTNRGCKAVTMSRTGIQTVVFNDGMTRGPVFRFCTIYKAHEAYEWFKTNFDEIKQCFDQTSSFARLTSIKRNVAAHYLFVRFVATTGDAMGMNMLSKGVESVLSLVKKKWPTAVDVISISGNYCIDKKPSAINWIEGRGKSVVAEAVISDDILSQLLKTDAERLVQVNQSKNMLGSIMAGSIGGFNAQAANIVAAMFIACGQDPAQVVSSSNCLTWLELTGSEKRDLYISCTMYSLEVGTVGGGTKLSAQQACLQILGVAGPSSEMPGTNSAQFARIICAAVLASELSLLSALSTNELVTSHLRLNRRVPTLASHQ